MSITRRKLLSTAGAITVAGAAPAALAQDDALLLAIEARHDEIHATPWESDEQTDCLADEDTALEERMAETPARTLRGLLAKLRVIDRSWGPFDEGLGASIIDDAERLLGG